MYLNVSVINSRQPAIHFFRYLIMIRKNQLATSNCFYNRFVGENPSIQWADRIPSRCVITPLAVNQVSNSFTFRRMSYITLTQIANNYLQKCYPADLVTKISVQINRVVMTIDDQSIAAHKSGKRKIVTHAPVASGLSCCPECH